MAYSVSDNFKTNIKDGTTPQMVWVEFSDKNGNPVTFRDEDIVQGSVSIEQYFVSGEELKYGECPSDTLSFAVFNSSNALAGFDFGKCDVYLGVQIAEEDFTIPSGKVSYLLSPPTGNAFSVGEDGKAYVNGTALTGNDDTVFYSIEERYPEVWFYGSKGYVLPLTEYDYNDYEVKGRQSTLRYMTEKGVTPGAYTLYNVTSSDGVYRAEVYKNGKHETYELVSVGTFIVNRPVNTHEEILSFSDAYSEIVNAEADASEILKDLEATLPSGTAESKTLNAIAARIWDGPYEDSSDAYASVVYDESPFPNATYTKRQLLSLIAERLRSIGTVRDGTLKFVSIGDSVTETIGVSDIAESSFAAYDVPTDATTGVILKAGDSSLVFGDDTNPYYIYNNPLITTITQSDLAGYQSIMRYFPCSFTVIYADPSIEVGDLIDVEDLINNYVILADSRGIAFADEDTKEAYAARAKANTIPLLQRTLRYNGRCTAEYRAPGTLKHDIPDSVGTNVMYAVNFDNALDQEEIFNRLTNSGQAQGLYLDQSTGDLYVNASYINTGTLTAIAINNGSGTFTVDENGHMTATSGTIGGFTLDSDTLSASTSVEPITFTNTDTARMGAVLLGNLDEATVLERYPYYDLDGDGHITVFDVELVADALLGIIPNGLGSSVQQIAPKKQYGTYSALSDLSSGTGFVSGAFGAWATGFIGKKMKLTEKIGSTSDNYGVYGPESISLHYPNALYAGALDIGPNGLLFWDSSNNVSARYLPSQDKLAEVGNASTGTQSSSCSDISIYNAIVIVFQISSSKSTVYVPGIELKTRSWGSEWIELPVLYNETWKAYLSIRFTSATQFEYIIRQLTGWNLSNYNTRITIYGVS